MNAGDMCWIGTMWYQVETCFIRNFCRWCLRFCINFQRYFYVLSLFSLNCTNSCLAVLVILLKLVEYCVENVWVASEIFFLLWIDCSCVCFEHVVGLFNLFFVVCFENICRLLMDWSFVPCVCCIWLVDMSPSSWC